MVGVLAGDHLAALPVRRWPGGTGRAIFQADSTDFRPARGEEDALEAGRAPSSASFVASSIAGGWATVQLVVKGRRRHLRGGGRRDLLAVRVAEVHAVEAGEPVDVATAVGVEDVAPLAAVDDRRPLRDQRGHVGEVEHQVLLGE